MARTNFPESLNSEFELIKAYQSSTILSNFRVRTRNKGRQEYTIRLLDPSLWSDNNVVRSFHDFFERFAEISSRAYIPQVKSVVGAMNRPVYVLEEYISGENLGGFIRGPSGKDLASGDLAGVFYRVCEALHHAHQKDVLHLCVTPQDIIVQDNNLARIKLGGFGTQLFVDAGRTNGVPAELARYLAPEVAQGDSIGPYSDVYSLAVTIAELFPEAGEWRPILARCVSRNPSDRFARVRDFAKALQDVANKTRLVRRDSALCPIESRGGLVPVLKHGKLVESSRQAADSRKPVFDHEYKRIEHDSKPPVPFANDKSAGFKALTGFAVALAIATIVVAVYFYQAKEKEIATLKQNQALATLEAQKREAERVAKIKEDESRKAQQEKKREQAKKEAERNKEEKREAELRIRRIQRDQDLPTFAANYPEDVKDLLWKAIKGDTEAQTEMGSRYFTGKAGVPQDYGEAAKWFYDAAEKGKPKAQRMLGLIYQNGMGVASDCAKALKWYREASKGDKHAMCLLGRMYENGECVSKNYDEAIDWYRKGATPGNSKNGPGRWNLGVHFKNSGNLSEAMKCFRGACDEEVEEDRN